MRQMPVLLSSLLLLLLPVAGFGQSPQDPSLPRLMTISGTFRPADGQPAAPVETVTLSIYADQQGGTPLWQETQPVTIDDRGRYTIVLGAAHAEGIPSAVFATGAQWLGTVFERPGEMEGARVRLTSVPYALRAADADTLGGRPASDYVVAPGADGTAKASATAATAETGGVSNDVVLAGTPNFLAKYVNPADVGSSGVFEAADGSIGLGTTTPFDRLHVRYDNNTGDFTGLAVQNTNGGAFAYSGMLFYDHTNALTQFQGYNNATHEYRINNIARVTPGGAFNGSINFMLGGASKFLVAPNGNIGIGTTSPSALLEVSNAVPGGPANMWMTSFTNLVGPYYMSRRARGTPGAPTAVQSGDGLAGFYGQGYGTTAFGPAFTGGMTVQAAQNWTDAAQGTALTFTTTAIGATAPTTRMTIDATGFLGIGTTTTPAAGVLEVSNAANPAPFASITGSSFTGSNGAGTLFIGRKARGTSAAPTAVQNGDNLAAFQGEGYGATAFSLTRGGMFVRASENWTDTAQGTLIQFNTTTNGTSVTANRMTIDNVGNVGIGTFAPQAPLEIVRQGDSNVQVTAFNNTGGEPFSAFLAQGARGTPAAPTALQTSDLLGFFGMGGYGTTNFFGGQAGVGAVATENWTDTARGSAIGLVTTPIGGVESVVHLAVLSNGNVGIDTPVDVNGIPTAADKLQVFGDIRVGNAGTNGCLKNFTGTGIAGTCASDRRFKKNITPFAPVLDRLTKLQPVHYFWRTEDFPARHFGNSRAYGLIAQDVEQVLPELVATDGDGYKAVDYSKLPLLTIQAVKELKAENDARRADDDARKAENDALKQRVAGLTSDNQSLTHRLAELERLVTELLATAGRR